MSCLLFCLTMNLLADSYQLDTCLDLKGILKLFNLTADVDMLFKIFIELYPYMFHAIQQKK